MRLLSGQMIELSLTQARARLETVTLQPLTLSPEKALEIARENRGDWKNARAALVDVWRQVEVAANDLESDLSVTLQRRPEHDQRRTRSSSAGPTGDCGWAWSSTRP